MASHLTLAVAQAHTLSSTALTLAALGQVVDRAAEAGVDLILFPEAYLGGYPRGAAFGSAVGSRTEAGREQFLAYFQAAIDLGDTPTGAGVDWLRRRIGVEDDDVEGESKNSRRGDGTREELERIARESGVFVVTGLVERAGGSLYCAVLYIDPKRGCIGKRRKVMPTGTERLVWGQGSPSTLRAVKTTIKGVEVTLAAAICWENFMPLLRTSLYSQGVNVYLAPTADQRDSWLPLMRTIALEGRTFVLSANQCIEHEQLPSWIKENGVSPPSSNQSTKHAPSDSGVHSPRSKRRPSVVTKTKENHEIAWPSSMAPLSRKTSITVAEGGHEICLPASIAAQTSAVEPSTQHANGGESLQVAVDESSKTAPDRLACRGGSCIVAPNGTVLAGPLWDDTDGFLQVKVDFDDCIRSRLDFDCIGHYSRNDSFELSVRGLDLNPP